MQNRFTLKIMGRLFRVFPILVMLLTAFTGSVSAQCTWTASTVFPVPTLDMPVVAVGSNMYSFSGVSNGALPATSYKYDGTAWSTIAPLPTALEFPTAVTNGTDIYIMGGSDNGGTAVTTNYRYNVATNTYTTMAPFTGGTWAHTAVYLNGKIYKIGGIDNADVMVTSVQIYDIASNTWSAGAGLPQAAGFLASITLDGYIYVAGGIGTAGTNKTYRYDPVANTWDDAAIADLPATRWGAAYAAYRNGFVLAGGYVGGDVGTNTSNSVISWNPSTNSWDALPNLLAARNRMTGTVYNDNFHVVGGRDAAGGFVGTNNNQRLTCPPLTACTGTPNPGNTFASALVVCSGTSVSFTAQNATAGTGVTYQWQTAPAATGPWTNAPGASTNASYNGTVAATGFYRVTVTCGGNSGTSTPVQVTVTPCTCINPGAANICEGAIQQLSVAGAGIPGTATASSGAITLPVPDASAAGTTATLPVTLPAGASITSISVNLNLTHTWVSDMIVNLIAPDGSVFNLVNARGGSGDNFTNTTISTASTTSFATGTPPFNGTFAPDYALNVGPTAFSSTIANFAAFNKNQPTGLQNWRLGLRDLFGGDLGTLTSWSITINYDVLPTAVWTGGTFFTDAAGTTPYVAGSEANTVYVRPSTTTTYTATIASGPCAGANNVTVTVRPRPVVAISPASGCGPLQMTASGAATYLWSPSAGLSSATGATVTGNPTSTTTYSVIGTSNEGCQSLPATAVVNSAPTASVIAAVAGSTYQINEGFDAPVLPPTGWTVSNQSVPIGPGAWSAGGGTAIPPAFDGAPNSCMLVNYTSATGTGTISNWLLTTPVNIKNGDIVSFYTRASTGGGVFPDRLELRMSTAGTSTNTGTTATSVGDFTTLLLTVNPDLTTTGYPETWTKFSATVTGITGTVQGRIAFRYFVTNGGTTGANSNIIGLDRVTYETPATVNCANVVTNIKVDITGGVGPYTVVYSNGTTNTTVPNYTSGANIQVSPAVTTTYTIVSVTGANGCVGTGNSGSAVITITPPASITTQPPNTNVCLGNNVNITVAAGPSVGNSYQWQVSTDGTTFTDIANAGVYSGATTATLTITGATAALNGNLYRVRIAGACGAPVTSNAATLSVNTAAVITTQPVNTSICVAPSTLGNTASFSVAATGNNISYQWQVSTNGGTSFANVSGSEYTGGTSNTLTLTNVSNTFNGYQYRVLVTTGGCAAVTSSVATLTTKPATNVVLSAAPGTSIIPGQTVTLSAAVSPVAGTSYTWYRDGVIVPNATNNTLVVDVDGLGTYTVAVADANSCGGTSNAVTITGAPNTTLFIYPSPNNGQFQIRYFSEFGPTVYPRLVNIYDSKGSRVYSKSYNINSPYTRLDVDASKLSKGIYSVELIDLNGNRIKTGRVVIN